MPDDIDARLTALESASVRQREQIAELRLVNRVLSVALATAVAAHTEAALEEWIEGFINDLHHGLENETENQPNELSHRRIADRARVELDAIGAEVARLVRLMEP